MSTKQYLNRYTPPPPAEPLPVGFGLSSPPNKYDHHFNGNKVPELRSNQVYLQPLTPSLHAHRLAELFMAYPRENVFMNYKPKTLDDVIYWMEVNLRSPSKRLTWALYSLTAEEQASNPEPPLDRLAGFVGVSGFEPDNLSIVLGPLMVFPPFRRSACATHASWLVQYFAFNVLGCYKVTSWAWVDNHAAQEFVKKSCYQREHIGRSHFNHANLAHKESCEKWLKENPSKDIRDQEKVIATIAYSMRWDEFRELYQMKAIHANLQVSLSDSYHNSYTQPPPPKPLSLSEVNESTNLESYDVNFMGPAKVLRCSKVLLVPFVPKLHARKLQSILSVHPGQIEDHLTSLSQDLESYEGMLRYFETIRRDEHQTAWVVFDCFDLRSDEEPSIDKMVGFAVMKDLTTEYLSAAMGPMAITPSLKAKDLDLLVTALLIRYAMSAPSNGGLGRFQLQWQMPSHNEPLIDLAKSAGFVHDGETYFVHAPGWKHNSDQGLSLLHYPSLDSRKEFDPRQTLAIHRRWIGNVVYADWIRGGLKEKIESILKS